MKKRQLLLANFIVFSLYTQAQCISSIAMTPNLIGVNGSIGSASWSTVNNVKLSDNQYNSSSFTLLGEETNYITFTNFNFSIPSTAIICGIEVKIERSESSIVGSAVDNEIRLIKGGIISGSNYSNPSNWSQTDTEITYGSSDSAWGTTWLPADINSSDFGLAISVSQSGGVLPTVNIDLVEVLVYYDFVLSSDAIEFEVNRCDMGVEVSGLLSNNSYKYTVERSDSDVIFSPLFGDCEINANSFRIIDELPYEGVNYYRVLLSKSDGSQYYSEIKAVEYQSEKEKEWRIERDYGKAFLSLKSNKNENVLYNIFSMNGSLLYTNTVALNKNEETKTIIKINEPGVYIAQAPNNKLEPIKFIIQ